MRTAKPVKPPDIPLPVGLIRGSNVLRSASTAPALGGTRRPSFAAAAAEQRVPETEVINSPTRVREVLRAVFAHRCTGQIRASVDGRKMAFKIQPARLEPEQPFPLQWQLDEPSPSQDFVIEVEGYVSVFRFDVH